MGEQVQRPDLSPRTVRGRRYACKKLVNGLEAAQVASVNRLTLEHYRGQRLCSGAAQSTVTLTILYAVTGARLDEIAALTWGRLTFSEPSWTSSARWGSAGSL